MLFPRILDFQLISIWILLILRFHTQLWIHAQLVIRIVWIWLNVCWKGYDPRVIIQKSLDIRGGWNVLPGQKFRCVWPKKRKMDFSHILEFWFHEACSELDRRGYACVMNMVDSAFGRVDVGCFSHGIRRMDVAFFLANGSGFVARLRAKFPKFSNFSQYGLRCS